ncbi:uncharacterized protein LOC129291448 isoform X1 [Prosopis cineraria]|uniref:uncharacterized protein LOC129291448 isoform X1 n=1 Tax=Prosopis cineraria TaxID=364024 RepID=UPI00241052AD|nr:uncharacterized protein LOC129291448 isoform X1 [Prosopis cineraria]XP_054784775.1 uncharacterized protein LOC129291448 isoform X1 [Prosopis cineraria]
MASSQQKKISLTLVINEKNEVLYAEADNDFVDVLLSVFTLPLGTISRLVSMETTVQPCRFNCTSSLHHSTENLDPKFLTSDDNRGKLLNPINPMEADSKKLVLDLVKFSLRSKTTLTDVFLRKKLNIQNFQTRPQPNLKISELQQKVRRMKLKVMISESKSRILFAQAERDFIDQILSFLTIPLAAAERLVQCNSGLGCIDNLYKSLANLDETSFFSSKVRDLKDKLLNPLNSSNKIINQLLPFYILGAPSHTCCTGYVTSKTMFIVADDLSIKPYSLHAALTFLHEYSKDGGQDLGVRDVSVGVNEVLEILKAAMSSSSALTTGLRPFLSADLVHRSDCIVM